MGRLVENHKQSLYNGVNQQSAEHRLETQVESSVNAYPTVNNGLLKRNPTNKLELSNSITYQEDMFTYEYDRGLSGDNEEKYSVSINDNGLEIIDVVNGNVYKDGFGLSYEGNAEEYLFPFAGLNGYSATTIKDTTFIANKTATPEMDNFTIGDTEEGTTDDISVYYAAINLIEPVAFSNGAKRTSYSPASQYKKEIRSGWTSTSTYEYSYGGSTTTVIIDGITIKLTPFNYTKVVGTGFNSETEESYNIYATYSWASWKLDLINKITSALPAKTYSVFTTNNGLDINIKRTDGNTVAVAFNVTMNALGGDYVLSETSTEAQYYSGITYSDQTETVYTPPSAYLKQGFVWVKSSNPSTAYTYYVTVKDALGNTKSVSVSNTTTDGAATALAAAIDADTNFSAIAVGSVVEVTADTADMDSCQSNDSYGGQASFGWAKAVQSSSDLPKNLGFEGSLVAVTGSRDNAETSYWLLYKNGQWSESMSNDTKPNILADTMPHVLIRNSDDTFTLKAYDGWDNKKIGDDLTNPTPSFIRSDTSASPVIKDIFFFKNRLGFITERTVIMSEVGQYGNFFRTTVAALLDSDRIDTTVDTTKAIQLEYSTYLEDSLMLFSDKAQFKLEGGNILSPKSVQISQTSAYEMNKNVRPLFMNDKVFFCAKRGNYTAVMQYFVDGNGRVSEAMDISSHIESYIPADVTRLTGSSINNMLFLTNRTERDTLYVYKFLDNGSDRVQAAWFRWTYNGSIYGAFSLGKNLNILINRNQSSAVTDWIMGDGIWDSDQMWDSDSIWYSSPESLVSTDNFEIQAIHPQNHNGYFVDASEMVDDTNSINYIESTATSSIVSLDVEQKITSNIEIEALTSSTSYGLEVVTNLDTYTSDTDSISIPLNAAEEISSISYTENDADGQQLGGFKASFVDTPDDNVLFNGTFAFGLTNWTFTDWDLVYNTKDIGSLIPVDVGLGEWVLKSGGESLTRGHLSFKTAQINSESGSSFFLNVSDIARNTSRIINGEYTVGRKPMIYGNSKNIRLNIRSLDSKGFRINSISLEGNYNKRSTRI